MDRKEKIFFALIQLFLLTLLLPYNDIVSGVITGGLLLACLLFNKPREKWMLLKQRKSIGAMVIFFAWMLISFLLSKNKSNILPTLDTRLCLFYFPVTIGLV